MAKIPNLPNLDGLIGLAGREGVDVRPTLLRVLTDLYVQKAKHARDEELRYTELTLWLLTSADVQTRGAVARKLATFSGAPPAVVRRLARDAFEVAEPILLYSSVLGDDEFLAIADQIKGRHAQAVKARKTAVSPPPSKHPRLQPRRARASGGSASSSTAALRQSGRARQVSVRAACLGQTRSKLHSANVSSMHNAMSEGPC